MSSQSPQATTPETEALIEQYLPLVQHIVHQVSVQFPRHIDPQELARAGTLGLVQAAHRFDEARGVPFRMFAGHRIRGAILDAVRQADWAPRSLRRDARKVEATRNRLAVELRQSPSAADIADDLGMTVQAVQELEGHITRSVVLALDESVAGVGDEDVSLGDVLCDRTMMEPAEALEVQEMHGYLRDSVALLPEKHRAVIQGTFLDGRTSQEVADELGVTVSRISQLRTEALEMLRDGITAQFDGTAQQAMPRTGRVARRKAAYAAAIASRSVWRDRLAAEAPVPAQAQRYA